MQNISPQHQDFLFKSLRSILFINEQTQQASIIRHGNRDILNRNSGLLDSEQQNNKKQNTDKLFNTQNTVHDIPTVRGSQTSMNNFQIIMKNNQRWSMQNLQKDPQFFSKNKNIQKPQYLWIGCSDSRVSANQISGMKPGQLFVHRNIANQAPLSDVNCLSVIQFAVEVLKITDIIVCGHYGCGGVKAAFKKQDHGSLEAWLSFIRDLRARYRNQFKMKTDQQNQNLLVQLNVKQQVLNIARHQSVQKAWITKQQLRIHGLVYRLEDGILQNLKLSISSNQHLPQEFRIY